MLSNNYKYLVNLFVLAGSVLIIFGCATEPGDKTECPECNNKTELLQGYDCVVIEKIEVCGPDGHLHGEECHCFSNQIPTEINNLMYCLQKNCIETGNNHEIENNHDNHEDH